MTGIDGVGKIMEMAWEEGLCAKTINNALLNGDQFFEGRDKMAAISQTTRSNKISLKFVPKGPINNIPALVQIMAWLWSGDKPLSEPMMTKIADEYMGHSASMS